MIPAGVKELFGELFDDSLGEPIFHGRLGTWNVYGFKFNRRITIGLHPPKVIEEDGQFRHPNLQEQEKIEKAISTGRLQPSG